MAKEFVLEDGTGLTDSTTYVSTAEFRQYFENRGKTFSEVDTTVQGWLNDATTYADCNWQWSGLISSEEQALEIPRTSWFNTRGVDISDTVPVELKNGVSELAYARLGSNNVSPSSFNDNLSSISIGPTSKSFKTSASSTGKTSYPAANDWFKKLGLNDRLGRVCRV